MQMASHPCWRVCYNTSYTGEVLMAVNLFMKPPELFLRPFKALIVFDVWPSNLSLIWKWQLFSQLFGWICPNTFAVLMSSQHIWHQIVCPEQIKHRPYRQKSLRSQCIVWGERQSLTPPTSPKKKTDASYLKESWEVIKFMHTQNLNRIWCLVSTGKPFSSNSWTENCFSVRGRAGMFTGNMGTFRV